MDLERINQYNEKKAEAEKEERLLSTIVSAGDKVANTIQAGESKIRTVNIQQDLATAKDIDAVIKQLKEVQLASLLAGNKSTVVVTSDLGEAIARLGEKLDSLSKTMAVDKSDVKLINTVKEELAKVVAALDKKPNTEVVDAIKSLESALNFEPVVNVPAPNVTVDAPKVDLSALTKEMAKVTAAVKAIKAPIFDTTDIILKLDQVSQTINNLTFPVPNFIQDPYIRYKAVDEFDDGVATNVKYYGFLTPEGNWYIIKNDPSASAKTYRYAFGGDNNYEESWTNRASLNYGYPLGK